MSSSMYGDESDSSENLFVGKCIVYSVIFVVVAYLYRRWINGEEYDKETECAGRVAIVTGANSGIGKETALGLAQHGLHVILACRDMKKADQARDDIIRETGNANVKCMKLNLASFKSIRAFADAFLATGSPLHVLINNAGVMGKDRSLTEDGLELTIGVNHFGHFLLTMLLLRRLYESRPSRVINVSSYAHKLTRMDKDDLMGEKSYNRFHAYGQSKLANIYFTLALAKRIEGTGLTCNALHPGCVHSDISRNLKEFSSLFQKYGLRIFAYIRTEPSTARTFRWAVDFVTAIFWRSTKSGAQTSIYAALDFNIQTVNGIYYS